MTSACITPFPGGYVTSDDKSRATGLVHAVLEHPSVATVKAWTFSTDDAHGLYAKFGFTAPKQPQGEMEWRRPRPPAIV